MPEYRINLKNEDFFDVEVAEEEPAPKLVYDPERFFHHVINLPEGWSVDASQVLYIEPIEED